MSEPLISVIIPVYNAEKYLSKCVDSVLAQTYTNLEIILVNDGSSDNSGKICEQYIAQDRRIKVIHQSNSGVSAARNAGLKIAGGTYIGFVDADDFIDEDMYASLARLSQTTQSDIARCGAYGLIEHIRPFVQIPMIALENIYPNVYLWNLLFAKKCVEGIFFDTSITIGEDLKFCVEAFRQANRVAVIPQPKYHYVQRPNGATSLHFNKKKMSYFRSADWVYQYVVVHQLNSLKKQIQEQICYHAVGFLRQIALETEQDNQIIKDLQQKVRKGIFRHLTSKHKWSNKLFALVCCINFKLATYLYRRIQ